MLLPLPDGLPPALVAEFSATLFQCLLFHVSFILIITVVK